MKTVEVTLEWYRQAVGDMAQLRALESAGVDNWGGYEEIDWAAVDAEVEVEVSLAEAKFHG